MKKMTNHMTALIMTALMVTLVAPVTAEAKGNVKLNKTKVTLSITNKTAKPSIRLKVKNATRKVAWKSSNKKVAAVNGKGTVTAKKAGKAVITARTRKKSLRCRVTVKDTRQPESVKKTPSKTPAPSKTPVPKCEHVYEDTWAHFERWYETSQYTYTQSCCCGLFMDKAGYERHAELMFWHRGFTADLSGEEFVPVGLHGSVSTSSAETIYTKDKTYVVINTDYIARRTCTKCGRVVERTEDMPETMEKWQPQGRAVPITPPSERPVNVPPVTPPSAIPPSVTQPVTTPPPATSQPGA